MKNFLFLSKNKRFQINGVKENIEFAHEFGKKLSANPTIHFEIPYKIQIPNTSYGEDYAVGLSISRNYKIGRIHKPLYLCRRWDDNSDASLSTDAINKHNFYKDKLRTIEIKARKAMNLKP